MTYYANHAPDDKSACQWLDCADKKITEHSLRLGIGKSRTAWYHADCFFRCLLEVGPQKLKLLEVDQLIGADGLTDEEKQNITEKIQRCQQEKTNRKRKAEEDLNERYTKIAKTDLPWLSDDNLHEILIALDAAMLLTAARVCSQFYRVASKLLFDRVLTVQEPVLLHTNEALLPFVSRIKHMKIVAYASFMKALLLIRPESEKRTRELGDMLSKLPNLESLFLESPHEATFPFADLTKLTKLNKLHIHNAGFPFNGTPLTWVPALQPMTNLQHLHLRQDMGLEPEEGSVNFSECFHGLKTRLTALHLENIPHFDIAGQFVNLQQLTSPKEHYVRSPHMLQLQGVEPTEENLREHQLCYTHLTRLTSLTIRTNHSNMAPYTTLKSLTLLEHDSIISLPPLLEHLTCDMPYSYAPLTTLATALKSLTVRAVIPATMDEVKPVGENTRRFNMLSVLPDLPNCRVTLMCFKCPDAMPVELAELSHVTLHVCYDSYGKSTYSEISKYLEGRLPKRLKFTFFCWKNCKYKQKLLALLESMRAKTMIMIDIKDD